MAFLPYIPLLPIFDIREPRQPRKFSSFIDPLNFYTDEQFRKRYRFRKDVFCKICEIIQDDVARSTKRNNALSTATQLCVALRFYASGSFLEVCGDTVMAISKSSASIIVRDVSLSLLGKLNEYVKFPDHEDELLKIKKGFYEFSQFPGVVGAVDGTQIKIQSPGGDQEPYYVNRKNYHSINVQGICDHKGRFLNVVADWPGSVHDSKILSCSKIGMEFEKGDRRGILLGDSGYPCRPWLLTPFIGPEEASQKRYNSAHTRSRSIIEQTFGQWKRRFHLLHGEIRMKPIRACRIIGACAVLHNIAKAQNDDDDFDDLTWDEVQEIEGNLPDGQIAINDGHTFRLHFVQQHFSR